MLCGWLMQSGNSGIIPRRSFGKTGVRFRLWASASIILGTPKPIDVGIAFFDNCWEYHRGKTEDWMGAALRGKRDRVFLMTKVCSHGRGKDLAMKMLEQIAPAPPDGLSGSLADSRRHIR